MADDWSDKEYVLNRIYNFYGYAHANRVEAAEDFTTARYWWYAKDWEATTNALINGCKDVCDALACLETYSGWPDYRYCIPYYLDYHTGVTWKSICEAWVKDDFEGKEWTIACIDHMRKLMWDKPFKIRWASKPTAEAT